MRRQGFFVFSFLVSFTLLACPDTSVPGTAPPDSGGMDAALLDGALPDTGDAGDAATATGRIILFDSQRALDGSDTLSAGSERNVWMVKDDGTGTQSLTHLNAAEAWAPVWSPDGTRIAYESNRALDGSDALNTNSTNNIWLMKADGSGATPLTRLTAGHADSYNLVWSPDGTKIAYESQRALDGSDAESGVGALWIMNADGTAAKPLTPFVNAQAQPFAFSPDSSQIVYRSTGTLDGMDKESGSNNVWIMKADGTAQKHLTAYTAKVFVAGGSFSPDAMTVLFQSDGYLDGSDAVYAPATGAINVWTVGVASMTKTPLTNLTHADAHDPAFSPDGKTIVFGSDSALDGSDAASVENVWRMNADGSARAPLTKLTKSFDYPAPQWSKDGSQLLFASQRSLDGSDSVSPNGVTNGWLMKADGSGAQPVTKLMVVDCEDFTLNQ